MTYDEAKAKADALWAETRSAGAALRALSSGRGTLGLTPDAIKQTPEWKAAKLDSDLAMFSLQEFNSWFTRQFKTEIAADRKPRKHKSPD